ncbi:4-amino-4-deoxy-L-arabinose transferase-like glycosyltransferase [Granulicella aggregans]|uniref:4-amino-4-deoxy-L-arabinose transferase-like glycosyltransferase n=1 Tax=Granulicella aggregans TaxID=474949 RepID=A0A7W8E3S6_9BACT|nr:phospholipid carrier-dependent glycosyltransferase [Granulicella aggregans]MBB5057766.1 4-amino-4-deoxy-L-arabinose transferase-like glycosyltransferase [Granulicella aggregans]
MALILPVAVAAVLYFTFRLRGDSSRIALLRAAIFSVTTLVTISELLSIPYLLTGPALSVAWLITLAGATFFLLRTKKLRPSVPAGEHRPAVHLPPDLGGLDIVLAAIACAILAIIGVVAIVVPPNSWDVMEHHMPRVLFWVSNHTLRPFPTPDYTQIVLGNAAEIITLNSYLLSGSDRFANLVEFFSLAGSAIAVTLIASRFGARRTGQLLAALFVLTIPELLLESSGSMTTGVVTFFTVTACCFLLRAGAEPNLLDLVTAALACGLSCLTKGITFVYLPILLIGCIAFRPSPVRMWALKRLPLFIALLLAINAGQFVRAYQITGTPFDAPFPDGGPRLAFGNGHIIPASIAANTLRQITLQMGTPSAKLNTVVESAARKTIRILGQNPDDPSALWSNLPYEVDRPSRLETQAGNPVHFAIILACFAALIFLRLNVKDQRARYYTLSIIIAFIAYSAVIRWQPWGSRFHMPLFAMAAVLVGCVAERLLPRPWQVLGFSAFLLFIAGPYLLSNSTRSLLHTKGFPTIFEPRALLYFADQHAASAPAQIAMADAIKAHGCGHIAIDAYLPMPEPQIGMSPHSFYVYPFLAQLRIDGRSRFVRYIDIQNPTQAFASTTSTPAPCAIVCLSCRQSNGGKSDTSMGETQVFGDDELVFPK